MLRRSALILLFLLPCVLIWTEITLYSENSFYRHPEWIVSKRMLEFTSAGTDDFLLTRASLAQNHAHLGKWFGFQGITYRKPLVPQKIRLQVALDKNAYLYIFFGNSQKQSGLRVSANPERSTAFVTTSP